MQSHIFVQISKSEQSERARQCNPTFSPQGGPQQPCRQHFWRKQISKNWAKFFTLSTLAWGNRWFLVLLKQGCHRGRGGALGGHCSWGIVGIVTQWKTVKKQLNTYTSMQTPRKSKSIFKSTIFETFFNIFNFVHASTAQRRIDDFSYFSNRH